MKEYKCVKTRGGGEKVGDPTENYGVSKIIEDYEEDGWHLHTYQVSYCNSMMEHQDFYHFLLFEKEKTI